MDAVQSYDLNKTVHNLRYFWPSQNLSSLLDRVAAWVDSRDVEVIDVNVATLLSEDEKGTWEYSATLTYFGNGDVNVEA